jgi:hypothetical protein
MVVDNILSTTTDALLITFDFMKRHLDLDLWYDRVVLAVTVAVRAITVRLALHGSEMVHGDT